MEEVDCLLCGCPGRRIHHRGHDRLHPVPGEFTLVECARCGFLYLSPRPDAFEIRRHYPSDYGPFTPARSGGSGTFYSRIVQHDLDRRCETVLRYRSGGDLLDVGAGGGRFISEMQSRGGWCVRGLEPYAPTPSARTGGASSVTVDRGTLDDSPYPPESFDVVTLWEVLEHLPRPLDALRQIYRLLRPGGVLVLSVPNGDSFDAKIFGPYWCGLDVPRHFSVFSRAHIQTAVLAAGFERPDIFAGRGVLGGAHGGLYFPLLSVHLWLNGGRSVGALKRLASGAFQTFVNTPAALIGMFVLTLPYSILSRRLNRATQLFVVAGRS
jgi:SAM-dependent methyltransferase